MSSRGGGALRGGRGGGNRFGGRGGSAAKPGGRGGGRGGSRGGRPGRGGSRGGKNAAAPKQPKVLIEKHRHAGIYIAKGGKDDALVTLNLDPGHSVYGEKRISVETDADKVEYRVWNPFRSKIASAIVGGIENIHIAPGKKVLYLGAANGTTVSHVSDVVGNEGVVYAVEFSHRSGRDLVNMLKRRTNIIPIVEDARFPLKYRVLIPDLVDVVFADVAQPDQARIVALNAQHFLKAGGNFVISIKASCIDSTSPEEAVFASEIKKLKSLDFKPSEYVTLEPFERGHACVVGTYRPPKTEKDKKQDK